MEMKVVKCCSDKFWCSNGIPVNGKIIRECPVDCKQSNGKHYPIINGLCTCPLCSSNCNFAHPFGMCMHINVTERALKAGKIDLNAQVQRDKDLFHRFKSIVNGSTKMATSYSNDVMDEIRKQPKKFKCNSDMMGYIDDSFYKSKAEHVMVEMRQKMTAKEILELGKIAGNKTECPIPGGTIDTRSIATSTKRIYNNNLEAIEINDSSDDENDKETTPIMESNLKPSLKQVTNDYLIASKNFQQPVRPIDLVMKDSEEKASANVRNLQATFDNEIKITKVKPPSGESKDVKVHIKNVNACGKRSKIVTDPAILLVKRAKRRATGLSHLNKVHSRLTEYERKEKKENLPTLKYYKEVISAGTVECQLLVETAADTVLCSPSSVKSELIHQVVKNMSEY